MKEVAADFAQSVGDARKLWGWYFALGVVLILVGLYCIWAEGIATLASVLVLGVVHIRRRDRANRRRVRGARRRTRDPAALGGGARHHHRADAAGASRPRRVDDNAFPRGALHLRRDLSVRLCALVAVPELRMGRVRRYREHHPRHIAVDAVAGTRQSGSSVLSLA